MAHHDDQDLLPTPGQRVSTFLKRKDVAQTFILGIFFTAVFVVLGLWVYPHWMPNVMSKEMQGNENIMIWFTVISAPIAGVVLAIAMESFINMHRGDTPPAEDGPGIKTHGPVVIIWSAVSTLFCILAIVPFECAGDHRFILTFSRKSHTFVCIFCGQFKEPKFRASFSSTNRPSWVRAP